MAATGSDRRAVSLPMVVGGLTIVVVLAALLPYRIVRSMHDRRLHAADRQAGAIAEQLGAVLTRHAAPVPTGVAVLAGPGDHPRAADERWFAAPVYPLDRLLPQDRALTPDPWGNAYVVNIGTARNGHGSVWVLSAGPDGVLQTPFDTPADLASGDDRGARVRQ